MFSGLMSRCSTPAAWAQASASATSLAMPTAAVGVELHLPGEPRAERLPLDVGHGVVEQPGGFARVMEREDVGVLQPGGGLDLALEALGAEGGAELGPQDLQRDPPAVLEVFGEVDRGHPAAAELALDPVALGQGSLEPLEQVQDLPLLPTASLGRADRQTVRKPDPSEQALESRVPM